MFGFIKKVFVITMKFLVSSVNSLKFLSIGNQQCKTTAGVIDINSNEPIFYPYSIKVN